MHSRIFKSNLARVHGLAIFAILAHAWETEWLSLVRISWRAIEANGCYLNANASRQLKGKEDS